MEADPGNAGVLSRLREDSVGPLVIEAVSRLARGEPKTLDSLLCTVGAVVDLPQTRARCRCHFVERDGNRRVQTEELIERLAEEVLDYCIPRSRVLEALSYLKEFNSSAKFVALTDEAKELFAKVTPSGEGGELMLYLLLENLLRLPQLFCKMPLKTNAKMHVHGVDGVHGKLLEDGTLALYWGEAKLHASVGNAIDQCFASLAPYLTGGSTGAAKRDLLLLRDNLDLGDPGLDAALLAFFDRSRPEAARIQFRGACLIGFDLDVYPEPFAKGGAELQEEVGEAILRWQGRIGRQIETHSLQTFELEIFCVPMPSVAEFRDKLVARISR